MLSYSATTTNSPIVTTSTSQKNYMSEITASSSNLEDTIPSNSLVNRRVKIYELTLSSTWEDKGTGYVSIEYVNEKSAFCVVVRSEVDNQIIMENRVLRHDAYQRQQGLPISTYVMKDTLIVWTENDGRDLALSFQIVQGCSEIWDGISDIQQKLLSSELHEERPELDITTIPIPTLDLQHLSEYETYVIDLMQLPAGRERLLSMVLRENFLQDLLEVFEVAEDMEMTPEIVHIYNIVRSIILLNDNDLFIFLLNENICLKLCALFEHDPDYPIPKGQYRTFLQDNSRFKTVGTFKDTAIEEKIHQTFRAQYLKDVVLARIIEDPHFNVLHSIVMFNQVSILNAISTDDKFLSQICADLKNNKNSLDGKKMILYFLQEFCNIARSIQMVDRQSFYSSIISKGILQELQPFLRHSDSSLRLVSADILSHTLDHDSSLIRSFIVTQKRLNQESMTEVVIRALLADPDCGMKYHFAEILKMLLDTTNAVGRLDSDGADFIAYFYNEHISILLDYMKSVELLTANGPSVVALTEDQSASIQHIIDILSSLVRLHAGRIKSVIIRDGVLTDIMKCLNANLGFVRLLPIRFLRVILGSQDEFLYRHIVKNNLLKPVIRAYEWNGARYNMLNSAVLDLLEYISTNKIVTIIRYLVENFNNVLSSIAINNLGQRLLGHNSLESRGSTSSDSSLVVSKAWANVDENEEAYFDAIDEERQPQEPLGPFEQPPPLPSHRSLNVEDDFVVQRLDRNKDSKLSKKVSPMSINIRPRKLVNYPDDEPPVQSSYKISPNSSPKLRSLSLGSKRQAIDDADPRQWDRELVPDTRPVDHGSADIEDASSVKSKDEDQDPKKKMKR